MAQIIAVPLPDLQGFLLMYLSVKRGIDLHLSFPPSDTFLGYATKQTLNASPHCCILFCELVPTLVMHHPPFSLDLDRAITIFADTLPLPPIASMPILF